MRPAQRIVFPFLMQDSCPVCLSLRSRDAAAGTPLQQASLGAREGAAGSAAAFRESFSLPAYPSRLLAYLDNSGGLAPYQLSFGNFIFL